MQPSQDIESAARFSPAQAANRLPVPERSVDLILRHLADRAAAIFVREPTVDAWYPDTSDIDVMAFGDVDGLVPQRVNLPAADASLPIDVIWLPKCRLAEGAALAREGLLAHRLAGSRLIFERTPGAARGHQALMTSLYEPDVQAARIAGFMELGFLAVREVGVTWDFPPMALFWLHAAFAAGLAAWADALRILCPNVYTRPFDCLRVIPSDACRPWGERCARALRLDVNPASLVPPLLSLHEIVARRFPAPAWPANMRATTRAEYAYFLAPAELTWRIDVAREMAERGDPAAAVYYLRFWAYCLSRVPMVWHCAHEGRDVSFMRPERAVGPALAAFCPESLAPLAAILGDGAATIDGVADALPAITGLREQVVSIVGDRGLRVGGLKPWAPHRWEPLAAQ